MSQTQLAKAQLAKTYSAPKALPRAPSSRPSARSGINADAPTAAATAPVGFAKALQGSDQEHVDHVSLLNVDGVLHAPSPAPGFATALSSDRPKVPIDRLAAVLFLDVDGVLHPPNPKHERLMFRTSCMDLLRNVCQTTGAQIVLSTTWRLHETGRTAVAEKLAEHGCPEFVSRTPSIAQFQRPREILAWVSKHQPTAWVAVDDWPLHEDKRMDGHFVQTRNRYGLEAATAARICALFAQQRDAAARGGGAKTDG